MLAQRAVTRWGELTLVVVLGICREIRVSTGPLSYDFQ